MVGKQNGTCCNPDGGVSEEDVVGKQDGAVRIGSRMWLQECELCGLVEEKGGNPPVSEKHLVIKQVNAGCNRDVEVPEE